MITMAGAAVITATAVAALDLGTGTPVPASPSPDMAATVRIERQTLVEHVTVDGRIGFGAAQPVAAKATGTLTWLAKMGSVVKRGQPLLRVDDQPVVLLYGSLPMYRDLTIGTEGRDVEQLERNLTALGYRGFTVDEMFSEATQAAVKRWQHELGLDETGSVAPGQVVYGSGPQRIAEQLVRPGATLPADVLTTTGTTKVVTADVSVGSADWAIPGAQVTLLADGVQAQGTVKSVSDGQADGGQSEAEGQGGPTVRVTVSISDQRALRDVDDSVSIRYVKQEREDVLTVPVPALLALAEGGYGVELVEPGATKIVAVQVGMFADGRVEVSGAGIQAGMTVRMPK